MDNVDRDLEKAEREASPERFQDRLHKSEGKLERTGTNATGSSSSSEGSVVRQEMGMSRVNTSRDLERHPTALNRIETQDTAYWHGWENSNV